LENHCVSGEGSGRSERLPSSRWRRKRRRAAWSVERRAVTREARGTHVVRLAEGVAEEMVGGEGEGHGGEWRRRFRSRARVSARNVVASRGETRDRKEVVVSRHPSWFGYRPRRACLGRVRRVEIRTPRPRPRRKRAHRTPKLASSTDTFSQTLVKSRRFFPRRHTSARAAGARRDPRPVRRFPRGDRDLGHAAEQPCPREPDLSPPRLARSRDVFRGPPRARRADDFASPGRARPLRAPRDVPRLRRGARGDRRVRGDARARAVARRAAPPRPRRGTPF
jgi:hypothetical protein